LISIGIIALIVGIYAYQKMSGTTENIASVVDTSTSPPVQSQLPAAPSGMTYYTDTDLGFSFLYPEHFDAQRQDTASGRLVIISSSTQGLSVQLQTRGWNDVEQAVTLERIRHDAPLTDIRDAQQLNIDGHAAGVMFTSTAPGVQGDIIQAWFILNKHLYQFTAPHGSVSLLNTILASFKI